MVISVVAWLVNVSLTFITVRESTKGVEEPKAKAVREV